MEYFSKTIINDHIYQIKDKMGVLSTLIIGSNKAMLIDTGYGIYNLNEYVRTITSLPLIVVLTHGHMDHSCGNYLFDKVYIHKNDLELVKLHNSLNWRKNNLKVAKNLGLIDDKYDDIFYLNQTEGNLEFLNYEDIFDLGDISVVVKNLEGHTKGSVGFLIKEDRIFVTSDGACPWVWLFLNESTTVSTYIKSLKRNLLLHFDSILVGHGGGVLLPRKRYIDFLTVAEEIDLTKAKKVCFNNHEDLNSWCYTTGTMYNQDETGVVFDPSKLYDK